MENVKAGDEINVLRGVNNRPAIIKVMAVVDGFVMWRYNELSPQIQPEKSFNALVQKLKSNEKSI